METTHDHYSSTDLDPACPMCLVAQTFAPIDYFVLMAEERAEAGLPPRELDEYF